MPKYSQKQIKKIADFDVIVKRSKQVAYEIKDELNKNEIDDVFVKRRPPVDEILPEQYEINIGGDIVAVLYTPISCQSYNSIEFDGKDKKVRIATIDTMLAYYLAFLYVDKPYYDTKRIMCMAKYLYDVQQKNLLQQKGLLRRFTIKCYGKQPTVEEIRAEKMHKYKQLRYKQHTLEYQKWFLSYRPDDYVNTSRKPYFKTYKKNHMSKSVSTATSTSKNSSLTRNKRSLGALRKDGIFSGTVVKENKKIDKPKKNKTFKKKKIFDPYGALKP
jgi:hypothetical protein